jgi:hypothetical protein
MSDLGPTLVTGVAAVAGTLLGGLTSFFTTYVTVRRQGHDERVLKDVARREALYAEFSELGSKLALDALEHPLDDPRTLVGIIVLAGRIRLTSSAAVLSAADAVIEDLIATYERPPVDPLEIIRAEPRKFLAPLIAFTQACRDERQDMLREI